MPEIASFWLSGGPVTGTGSPVPGAHITSAQDFRLEAWTESAPPIFYLAEDFQFQLVVYYLQAPINTYRAADYLWASPAISLPAGANVKYFASDTIHGGVSVQELFFVLARKAQSDQSWVPCRPLSIQQPIPDVDQLMVTFAALERHLKPGGAFFEQVAHKVLIGFV